MTVVLLTGATGFVGMQIYRALSKSNVLIVPVVRSGKEKIFLGLSGVYRVASSPDIFSESSDWWAEQCKDVNVVIHAAWYVKTGEYLESEKQIDCLYGSLNLIKGAAQCRVKRFIGIGTCFEYDLSFGLLSIETPIRPISLYASAKAALYIMCENWLARQGVQFAWCRLFYLYGEGEDDRRLVPYLHKRLSAGLPVELTTGEQIRDFLDVSEAGRSIATVALSDRTGPFNICSGVAKTVRQLAESIANEYGRRDLLKFGARAPNQMDPPRVQGVPNMSPF